MAVRVKRGWLHGFTLVEIMIVVAVIGLLAAIAVPGFMRAQARGKVTRMAADLRMISEAFQSYNLEYGGYPTESPATGNLPSGMEDYIRPGIFDVERTPVGGMYRWINRPDVSVWRYGYIVCIEDRGFCNGSKIDQELMVELDEMIDDGDKATGSLRQYGGVHYHYVIDFR